MLARQLSESRHCFFYKRLTFGDGTEGFGRGPGCAQNAWKVVRPTELMHRDARALEHGRCLRSAAI